MGTRTRDLPTVGWREWVGLPDLGVRLIKAKIDTGARSSSLHVFDLETFRRRGKTFARFGIHPLQRNHRKTVWAEAEVVEQRRIRSSSGHATLRPVIHTDVRLLGEVRTIELTLANRDAMGFRMLLGRQALRDHVVVDPGRSFYGGRPKRKKKASTRPKEKAAGSKRRTAPRSDATNGIRR